MRAAHIALIVLVTLASAACATRSGTASRELPTAARDSQRLVVLAVRNAPGPAPPRAGSTLRGYSSTDAYRVSDTARHTLQQLARQYRLDKLAEWPIAVLEMQCAVYAIPDGIERDDLLMQLDRDPRVRLAQPLQSFVTQAALPADPYSAVQQAMDRMSVPQAHLYSLGDGVRVAIIDTGMDVDHPDLVGRVELQQNFVDRDATRFRQDRHGTAVGGVIAANKDNGVGLIGVAPAARLLALKACWQLQAGNDAARCNTYTLAQALARAIELRPQIINLSLSGPADPLLTLLTRRATANGIVVVGPAGLPGAVSGFPAILPEVLRVASTESDDIVVPALRAPGSEVLTLAPGGRYQFASGDSIATAAISGIAALVLAIHRDLSAADLQELLNSATERQQRNGREQQVVNACVAVTAVAARLSCGAAGDQLVRRPPPLP